MVIHSVTPAHLLMEQPEPAQAQIRQVRGGYLEGRQTPEGFQATRLFSTDPSMYLKGEYAPGSVLGNQQQGASNPAGRC